MKVNIKSKSNALSHNQLKAGVWYTDGESVLYQDPDNFKWVCFSDTRFDQVIIMDEVSHHETYTRFTGTVKIKAKDGK